MNLAADLQSFVEAVEGKPVEWGVDDCCAWPAAWVEHITGRAPVLPAYTDETSAHVMIDAAGGLDVLCSQGMAAIGIFSRPYPEPELGAVGVINTSRYGQVGVIFAQDGIALWRAGEGTGLLRPRQREIVKVWSLAIGE